MSSSKPRKTSFNERWLLDDTFRTWLKPMPQDKFSAYCIICKTSFSLSNMGKQALKSHMGGKKHASSVKFSQFSSSLSSYFKKEHSNSEVTKNLNSVDNTPATNTNCVLPATATTTNTITYDSTAARRGFKGGGRAPPKPWRTEFFMPEIFERTVTLKTTREYKLQSTSVTEDRRSYTLKPGAKRVPTYAREHNRRQSISISQYWPRKV